MTQAHALNGESAGASAPGSLTAHGLVKHFGRVRANDGIDVAFNRGEVHALLGENGAGKSTLIKILAGVYQPDRGSIEIDGKAIHLAGPTDARSAGIAVVHQHSTLIPRLTLLENVALQEGGLGLIERDLGVHLRDKARSLGFDVDPRARAEELSIGDRQRAEIARALLADAQFVILDEPTAILAPAEREGLFELLRRLAAGGAGVVFVTHYLSEARRNCDRMTVLRHGKVVGGTDKPDELDDPTLVRMMIGDDLRQTDRPSSHRQPETRSAERLRIDRVSGAPAGGRPLHEIELTIAAGEVLGVAGVEGNGQRELAALLVGAWTPSTGTVELDGVPLHSYPTAERMRLIGDVPDEHELATCDELSIWENVALTALAWHEPPTIPVKRRWRALAARRIAEFDIRTPSLDGTVGQLSGGNRRRVVISRELAKHPQLLVASYATRGLDVRSTEQVKAWVRSLADAGTSIVYISSDLDEVMEVSDRIAVLVRGRIVGVVAAEAANGQLLGELMLVGATSAGAA